MYRTIFFIVTLLSHFLSPTTASEIIVSPVGSIKTIHSALSIAKDGDVITVKQGTYREGNIIIEKSITLRGENEPVLDGEEKADVVTIKKSHVTVTGFVIKNSGHSYVNDYSGIKITEAHYCVVRNNKLFNVYFGIYLAKSNSCSIISNQLSGNAQTEASSGNGIHLWYCNSITIIGNTIEKHRDGIYFEFAKHCNISYNTSKNNLRYGLHFMFSDGNIYQYNLFAENSAGVAVMYTKNIKMLHNTFRDNWGTSSFGLLLKDITYSVIDNNDFLKNTTAIYMENSSSLNMHNNTFENNGWALKIMANCTDDSITRNNFSGNSFDVSTNSSSNSNYFMNNYWDKYQGYDLNRDNIGDIPYRPVSVFSIIVEQIPYSVMLLRSFIVDLLDKAEKLMPAFIPESLIDKQPLMKKIRR